MGEDSVAEKLEIVRYLDQYYNDHNEIEKTSKEYEIIIEDNLLLAKVKYGNDKG